MFNCRGGTRHLKCENCDKWGVFILIFGSYNRKDIYMKILFYDISKIIIFQNYDISDYDFVADESGR